MDDASVRRAKSAIDSFFKTHASTSAFAPINWAKKTKGKVYELYCLSEVIADASSNGFVISFVGVALAFQGAPGKLDLSKGHFRVTHGTLGSDMVLALNVEIETKSKRLSGISDKSGYFEADIALLNRVPASWGPPSRPAYNQLIFCAECKSSGKLQKAHIRELIGFRAEMVSFSSSPAKQLFSQFSPHTVVSNVTPGFDQWLCYIDPSASKYKGAPERWGITFKNLVP